MPKFTGTLDQIISDGSVEGSYNDGQLKILGYITKTRSGKVCVVKCSVCSQDPELFGDALYTIYDSNIIKGTIPCGCSAAHSWSDEQWTVRLNRVSKRSPYKFLRFEARDDGIRIGTFLCKEHGQYTTNVRNYIDGKGCRRCSKNNLKPDPEMIDGFMQSGSFSEGTKFIRSDRKDSKGSKVYWKVTCSLCNVTYESSASHLKKGKQGCSCSTGNQRFSYLLQILDNNLPIAVKFGITKSPKTRIAGQRLASVFDIEPLGYWEFENNTACRKAELECSHSLQCGVLSAQDFPDGYTETTFIYNIDAITNIFTNNGGVLVYV